jgi:hypothetical protein
MTAGAGSLSGRRRLDSAVRAIRQGEYLSQRLASSRRFLKFVEGAFEHIAVPVVGASRLPGRQLDGVPKPVAR